MNDELPGDNRPLTDEEMLWQNLEERHAKLIQRAQVMAESFEKAPLQVDDETTARKFADAIDQFRRVWKLADEAHTVEKKPILLAGKTIDRFFNKLRDPLRDIINTLIARQEPYLKARAAREEEEARAEAQRQREAAARIMAAAKTDQEREDAAFHQRMADVADDLAKASPAERSRVHGDYGGVSSLQRRWKHEVIDKMALPPAYVLANDVLIRRAIREAKKDDVAGTIDLQISGVRIWQETLL